MYRLVALLVLACACTDDGPKSLVPADYSTFTQERDCRRSGDHDFNYIRVLTDPAATEPYANRDAEFLVDSIILKEEFDGGDPTCSGPIVWWTLMKKLPTGMSPSTHDWTWQKVINSNDHTVTQDDPRCINCHVMCGVLPDGYMDTCSIP